MHVPLPDDVALPVDFDDAVIAQRMQGDVRVYDIMVSQNQGIAAVGFALHFRDIVADGVALTLIVMVLTSYPARSDIRIFDPLVVVKFPDDFAVPVDLD